MTSYQQLIDSITLLVNDDRLHGPEDVEALAAQYRSAVKDVNKRLSYCDDLLQKGYRSEVVQEADRTPNLLDSVGLLDFSDLDLFNEMIRDLQLDPLPTLRNDIASEINACYSGNDLIDRLLRQFRLASLSLAPIKDRLTLLRKLHMMDDSNIGWEADLQVYERARVSQIQKEIISSTNNKNLRLLKSLHAELNSAEWITKPPSTIAKSIESTIEDFRLQELVKDVDHYLKDLQTAFQEQNLEDASILKESIDRITDNDPQTINAAGLELVEQVSKWINRQNHLINIDLQYNNLLSQLDRMLDDREPYLKVEQVYAAIQRLEKPVSDDRLRRIYSLKEETDTHGRRKFSIIIAASIIILVTAGVTTGLLLQAKSRNRRAMQYDTNLLTMIKNNRLDEAEKEIERIEKDDSSIAKRPEFVKRKVELATAQDTEQRRINEFYQIVEQITALLANGKGLMTELDKADTLVIAATELAIDPSEKVKIDRFKTEIIKARSANQKQIDDTFLASFKPLQEKAEQKDNSLDSLKTTMEQLLQLKEASSNARPEIVKLIDPITAQLQNQITQMQVQAKENEDRDRLINNFDSLSSYLNALNRFIEIQPRSRYTTQIKTILGMDSGIWQDLEAMESLQSKLKSVNISQMKVTEAKQIVSEWKRLSNRLKFHPSVETEPIMIKSVTKISNRIDEDGKSLVTKITDENGLGHPLIQTSKYMADRAGRAYYLAAVPTVNASFTSYSFKMYIDTDMRRTLVQSIGVSDIDNTKSAPPSWQNPVQSVANEITNRLLTVDGKTWDDLMGKLILDIESNTKIDDFQRFRCLSIILPIAIQGSYTLEEVFADHLKVLVDSNLDLKVNWANTISNEMNLARNKSQTVLSRLPDNEKTRKLLKERLITPENKETGPIYACVGALNKDESQNWTLIFSNKGKSIDGELYVYNPDSNKPSLVKVGSKTGTRFKFEKSSEHLLQEFRVVWIHESSNSQPTE